jgi:hypothetical protein
MKTLWDAPARQDVRQRLARLTPASSRRWGTMSAPQMVAHLVDAMRMAIGEMPVPSKNLPLRFTPIKQLVIYCLPFPKGAPTAPQLVSRPPGDWPGECATLLTLVDRFAECDRNGAWPDHPAFGTLTGGNWGVLAYRHIDHHFKQFGV